MTDKKKNGWVKFVPSLDLPKERVSIAYDTHDERGVRYAYGYFQFYNGTCGCFWKDGNEQPKVVKAEDIMYWMPIPSLDMQEEPMSEDLDKEIDRYFNTEGIPVTEGALRDTAHHFAQWQRDQILNRNATLLRTFELGKIEMKHQILKAMDLGEPPYLISVEKAYYDVKKLLEG